MLAFLAVLALLLFVAPITLFLIGYIVQRTLDKGPRRTRRHVVANDTDGTRAHLNAS